MSEDVEVGAVSQSESGEAQVVEISAGNVLAFVIDGVVQDVINCDDRLAAIFLSNPVIVELASGTKGNTVIGWVYDADNGTIAPPAS